MGNLAQRVVCLQIVTGEGGGEGSQIKRGLESP